MRQLQTLTLPDYLAMVYRRLGLILGVTVTLSLAVFFYVRRMPSIYRSETLILVEPQKVPENYVKSVVDLPIKDRLITMRQQILSRTRLERIITHNNLYAGLRSKGLMEDAIQLMRSDIQHEVIRNDAFRISYTSLNPEVAQRVTDQLASLFIEENLKDREEQSVGVSQFLESQVKETEQKLLAQEERVREFKSRFIGALPEQLQANLATLNRLQMQMQAAQSSLIRNQDQKAYLERLLEEYRKANKSQKIPRKKRILQQDPLRAELEKRKEELQAGLLRYTPEHPDVKRLKAQIGELEKKVLAEGGGKPSAVEDEVEEASSATATDNTLIQLTQQIESLESQIKVLMKEQQQVQREIGVYQSRVDSAPQLEQMMAGVTRDYEMTKTQYQSLLAKRNESQVAANLEKRQKGEQFRILDPANLPERPYKPDRRLLNLGGFGVSLVLGLGLALLLELLDDSVRSEQELIGLTGYTILVSIPRISDPLAGDTLPRPRDNLWKTLLRRAS